jgi:ABC-type phosphate transport system auxiliary subunit
LFTNASYHYFFDYYYDRQNWVTALELAKAKLIVDSEEDDALTGRDLNTDKQDLQSMLKTLMSKLDDLKTCHDLNVSFHFYFHFV